MSFTKLQASEGSGPACLTCGYGAHDTLAMYKLLAVGFGACNVRKDDDIVYSEDSRDDEEFWTAQKAEDLAKLDPDHDWRIEFYAPLYEAHYQRHGDGHLVLIKQGDGFA